MKNGWIRWTFLIGGLYDFVLGVIFLLFGMRIYDLCGVTRPNHVGYVQFPALLLMVFGIMFFRISGNPRARRELILYGMGLKIAYSGVVFFHALRGGIPTMWIPFAWIDVGFLLVFYLAWRALRAPAA